MNLDNAPSLDTEREEEKVTCDNCEAEEPFVQYDNDTVCTECQYVRGTYKHDTRSEWQQWLEHRDATYSGFYGDERVKMVGGFASSYDL